MRYYFGVIFLVAICFGCAQAENTKNPRQERFAGKRAPLRDIIGVTHVNGRYFLTDEDYLNEGAEQILALGSRVIKVWFHKPQESYSFNSDWPRMNNMVEIAKSPYFRELFDKPFKTYILMCFSMGSHEAYFRSGMTEEQKADEKRRFYELTKYLLTTYKGTGRKFVIQHWEGDWLIRAGFNAKIDPDPVAIKGMIDWLNARQAGVDKARREVGQNKVWVYHAAEVNRVVATMKQGRAGLVNKVLPYTNVDMVSYSAWDSVTAHFEDPNVFRDALDFIEGSIPNKSRWDGRRVYVGEFGMPQNQYSAEDVQKAISSAVETALDWGCPWIVYWQVYCNEFSDKKFRSPVKSNDAVRGFWLIRPDGSKTRTWDYFHGLLNPAGENLKLN